MRSRLHAIRTLYQKSEESEVGLKFNFKGTLFSSLFVYLLPFRLYRYRVASPQSFFDLGFQVTIVS